MWCVNIVCTQLHSSLASPFSSPCLVLPCLLQILRMVSAQVPVPIRIPSGCLVLQAGGCLLLLTLRGCTSHGQSSDVA